MRYGNRILAKIHHFSTLAHFHLFTQKWSVKISLNLSIFWLISELLLMRLSALAVVHVFCPFFKISTRFNRKLAPPILSWQVKSGEDKTCSSYVLKNYGYFRANYSRKPRNTSENLGERNFSQHCPWKVSMYSHWKCWSSQHVRNYGWLTDARRFFRQAKYLCWRVHFCFRSEIMLVMPIHRSKSAIT